MSKQKRSGSKTATAESDAAAADAEFDRLTKLLTALMPLHTARTTLRVARYALVGTIGAALVGAAATVGAALVKEEKSAAAPATKESSIAVTPAPSMPGVPSQLAENRVGGIATAGTGEPAKAPRPRESKQHLTAPTVIATARPLQTTKADPPVRTGTRHDGPHRGTIGWNDSPFTVDVENVGFRSPADATQGQISASADGIRSGAGVRIARFPSSAADFGRCADLGYHSMGTSIPAADLSVGDWICADDGVRYLATYAVEVVPGGGRTFYQLNGTSWFRP